MNPKLRAFLEANGLRAGATEDEAWRHYTQLQADGIEMPGIDIGQRSDSGGQPNGTGQAAEPGGDGARAAEFRGRTLLDICRESLELSGVFTRSMSRMQIAGRSLAAGSTSDFPIVLGSLVSRHLLASYLEWPSTWRPFVAVVDASDFKDIHAIKLSESPDLMDLGENGE